VAGLSLGKSPQEKLQMGDIIKAGASVTTLVGVAGICVAVVAAISIALIKKGVFPSITKAASAETINRLINALFGTTIVVAILGFALLVIQNGGDRQVVVSMVLAFLAFLVAVLAIYFGPRTRARGEPTNTEEKPQTVYDKLRNQGSRELGSLLGEIWGEYGPRWVDILNTCNTAARQGLVNGLYDNLRTIVHDYDGRVEHKKCWKRLVKLRDNVQVWKHNQQLLPPDVSKLLGELRELSLDFPMEAEAGSREAGDIQPPASIPSAIVPSDPQAIVLTPSQEAEIMRQAQSVGDAIVAAFRPELAITFDRKQNYAVHASGWSEIRVWVQNTHPTEDARDVRIILESMRPLSRIKEAHPYSFQFNGIKMHMERISQGGTVPHDSHVEVFVAKAPPNPEMIYVPAAEKEAPYQTLATKYAMKIKVTSANMRTVRETFHIKVSKGVLKFSKPSQRHKGSSTKSGEAT
jgi:hypothetical protein